MTNHNEWDLSAVHSLAAEDLLLDFLGNFQPPAEHAEDAESFLLSWKAKVAQLKNPTLEMIIQAHLELVINEVQAGFSTAMIYGFEVADAFADWINQKRLRSLPLETCLLHHQSPLFLAIACERRQPFRDEIEAQVLVEAPFFIPDQIITKGPTGNPGRLPICHCYAVYKKCPTCEAIWTYHALRSGGKNAH